ncbi:MAG TPA: radical SAM family heme chaperone HemW [Tepidisphaeraceae bacterium]|nr:radical SAM family heme chaperone HemW [Tepidisphaeraceae bacterium]
MMTNVEAGAPSPTLPRRTGEGGTQRVVVPISLPTLPMAAISPSHPNIHPASLPPANVQALYVHIPFCFHKCHYCDFYSITRQTPERMANFVELILREADLWTSDNKATSAPIRTIFFGGGTPSLLPLEAMRQLLQGIHQRFDLSELEEWTVEVNPASAALDYCRMLREHGVDRLSFGAQSFNINELKTLERHHDPADVPRSIELARQAGFERLNVDLIYAIPGQDQASWGASLASALALKTPHVSCYNLTYETNTPMAVRKRLGHFTAVDEETELAMFRQAREQLVAAGLAAYEISNYCMPSEECRHNLVYWTGGNYIGVGPSAASHVEGHRWRNRPHLGEWEKAVAGGDVPVADGEILSPSQRAGELAMLLLRLSRGVRYADFAAKTGLDARAVFAEQIARLGRVGLLVADENAIRLTEKGIGLADAIAAEFLESA